MDKKNKIFGIFALIFSFIFITVGFGAFTSDLTINDVAATVRPPLDVKVTNVTLDSATSGVNIENLDYNMKNLMVDLTLPKNGTVTFNVEFTNYMDIPVYLIQLTNLPDNLKYEIDVGKTDRYSLEELFIENQYGIKEISLTISYKDNGYDSTNKLYNLNIGFYFESSYTVLFHGNNDLPDRYQQILTGQTVKLDKNTFTYSGYEFTGWNTEPDGSGITYKDEQKVYNLANSNETINLYAQWRPYKSVINFDANGGNGIMDSIVTPHGGEQELPANKFTRFGYKFIGWNTEPDGSGVDYSSNSLINIDTTNGDVTLNLYAQWRGVFSVEELGYETDNLLLFYDGIINTGLGHNGSITEWVDLSGNDNSGLITGATWHDNHLSFDGVNDSMETLDVIDYNNSGEVTIELIDINGELANNSNLFVLFESSTNWNKNNNSYGVPGNEHGLHSFSPVFFSAKYNYKSTPTNSIVLGETAIYDFIFNTNNSYNNFIKVYKNGELLTLTTGWSHDISNKKLANYKLYIASRNGSESFTKINLAAFRVYNKELTQEEILNNILIDYERYNISN